MATIVQGITNTFVAKSLAGDIDFDTDTFKIALYTNDATLVYKAILNVSVSKSISPANDLATNVK